MPIEGYARKWAMRCSGGGAVRGNDGQAWLTENFLAPRICALAALQADTGTA